MLGESPKGDAETDGKTEVFVAQLCPTLCDPMGHSPPQALLSMGFPRQKHWSGLPSPFLGELSDPGIEPVSPASPALAGGFFTTSTTWEDPRWRQVSECSLLEKWRQQTRWTQSDHKPSSSKLTHNKARGNEARWTWTASTRVHLEQDTSESGTQEEGGAWGRDAQFPPCDRGVVGAPRALPVRAVP